MQTPEANTSMGRTAKHGGFRPGSGNRPKGRIRMEIQINPKASEWLRQVSRRALIPPGAIIERLIQLHCQKFVVRGVKKYAQRSKPKPPVS